MDIVLLIILGMATGWVSAFLGVGGGFFMVPLLYALFPTLPHGTVIATSLGVISVNATMNVWLYQKKGLQSERSIWLPMAPGLLIGAVIGSESVLLLPTSLVKKIFAISLLIIAARMLLKKAETTIESEATVPVKPFWLWSFLLGSLAGFASGLTGLGGGVVLIPIFFLVFQMSARLVPFYSNILMVYAAIAGSIRFGLASGVRPLLYPHWQVGHINLLLILNILVGSLMSNRFGVSASLKTSEPVKRYLFILLLFVFSAKMFLA
ncbi:MAG: sulfite exporter TauE/SafE family protein [Bdellovibrionales bacterium]|nr:sulfite exporter TauE/SafE family protein [Bdellovibrionales bacterium]